VTTCSGLTRRHGVDPAGTPPAICSWILLEHPGPWPETVRDDVFAAALTGPQHHRLQSLWVEQGLRPLVIRRPGRVGRATTAAPAVFVGGAHAGRRWLERVPYAALPTLDIDAVAVGTGGLGEPVAGPLLLVCTNGSVDRCCAVRGRPLVQALAAAHPAHTWEVSHVGGCRFAANLLVLPDAVVHGALDVNAGLEVAADAVAGRLNAGHLRGRTGIPPFAAAAEVAVRRATGLTRLDDVAAVEHRPHTQTISGEDGDEPAGAEVVVRAGGRHYAVTARFRPRGRHISVCDGEVELSDLTVSPPAPLPN